jgi:hypothetical protein
MKTRLWGVLFLIVILAALTSIIVAHAAERPIVASGTVYSDTVNNIALTPTSATVLSLSLPKGSYTIWGVLGGTDGVTVNCTVKNGSYDMFDFSGVGENSFIAGVTTLSATTKVNLNRYSSSDVTMSWGQLQAQLLPAVIGTVNHN